MMDERRYVIAGIGEVLWDVMGSVEKLGGAPINFAYHAGMLGAEAHAISTVGNDGRGRRAIAQLRENGVSVAHIAIIDGATTGYVQASVDAHGVASYLFPDDVAWDNLQVDEGCRRLAPRLDAVCFGSLAQRSGVSRRVIHGFLHLLPPKCLKVFDINIRQEFYSPEIIRTSLAMADVVKLNDEEIALIASMEGLTGDMQQQLLQLVGRYGLNLAVLTRGGSGSLLVGRGETSDHPGYRTAIVDTIGAGDAFTAATVLGLLRGRPLADINDHANRVAAFICGQEGAMVPLPGELRQF